MIDDRVLLGCGSSNFTPEKELKFTFTPPTSRPHYFGHFSSSIISWARNDKIPHITMEDPIF
jgi:hypothetical protein